MTPLQIMKQSLDALESNSPLWKVSNTIANLRTAIEEMEKATAHPAPIPEGWQLVPKAETKIMREVFFEQLDKNRTTFSTAYKDMLAAAPKPEGV